MERCINTNNILRRKLEELLVSNNISCLSTTNTSVNLSMVNSCQLESKSNKSSLTTSEPRKTSNLSSGVQTQLELGRLQPSDDEQQVDSGKTSSLTTHTHVSLSTFVIFSSVYFMYFPPHQTYVS